MKRVMRTVIGILILIVGMFIFLYPDYREWKMNQEVRTITEMVQATNQSDYNPEKVVDDTDVQTLETVTEQEEIETSAKSEMEEMYEWFCEYNSRLTSDSSKSSEEWNFSQSPIGSNAIGYIEIPEISLNLPLYIGATEVNMSNGAVVLTGTSMPIGGGREPIV